MTPESSEPSGRTELLTRATARIEACLYGCAQLTEAGNFEAAHELANVAAAQIRQLQHLMHERRGKPRKEVQKAISYYGAWQTACTGRLEVTKSEYRSLVGFQLLGSARRVANQLSHEYWNSVEYANLAKRIASWQAAAERHTIESSAD